MDEILRAAPYFTRLLTDYGLYEYRSPYNRDDRQMPDLNMAIETDGFYFCRYGDGTVFNAIVDYLQAIVEATGQPFVLDDDV